MLSCQTCPAVVLSRLISTCQHTWSSFPMIIHSVCIYLPTNASPLSNCLLCHYSVAVFVLSSLITFWICFPLLTACHVADLSLESSKPHFIPNCSVLESCFWVQTSPPRNITIQNQTRGKTVTELFVEQWLWGGKWAVWNLLNRSVFCCKDESYWTNAQICFADMKLRCDVSKCRVTII